MQDKHDPQKDNGLRIFYLNRLLERFSDEEHPLTTNQLIELLREHHGLSVHRTTVGRDIALLEQLGVDIVTVRSTQNRYFLGSRLFEEPELRLLADAIDSFKLIPPAKSEELIRKLSALTSVYQADKLKNSGISNDPIKPKNERIYYIVDAINRAIEQQKKISFLYSAYDTEKNRVLKNGGRPYLFSPYTCVWSDGYYYTVGYSEKHCSIGAFRVDRIAGIPEISEEDARPEPTDFQVSDYTKAIFRMFRGEHKTVKLLCDNEMMKVIIDRFGEKVPVEICSQTHFIATVEVSVSPTFFGWLFEFDEKIRILSPETVKKAYKQQLKKTLQNL